MLLKCDFALYHRGAWKHLGTRQNAIWHGFPGPDKKTVPVSFPTSSQHFMKSWPPQGAMETCANKSGLSSVSNGGNSSQQSELWRPWFRNEDNNVRHKVSFARSSLYFWNPNTHCLLDRKTKEISLFLESFKPWRPQWRKRSENTSSDPSSQVSGALLIKASLNKRVKSTNIKTSIAFCSKVVLAKIEMLWLSVPGRRNTPSQLSSPSSNLHLRRLQQRRRQRWWRGGGWKGAELNVFVNFEECCMLSYWTIFIYIYIF